MVRINFIGKGVTAEVETGTTILEAARTVDVMIESPCNAVGTCGKCKVRVNPEQLDCLIQDGEHHLSKDEIAEGFALACQAKVMGDIDVEVISKNQNKTLKILDHGESFDIKIDSFIKKEYDGSAKTIVYAGGKVIGEESGDTAALNFGVVVDIGTTTVVASLVEIGTGDELASVSALNPQSLQAQDVLSRIKFASDEQGLKTMYSDIIKEINRMILEIAKEAGINQENIYEVIFSGNTCMIHLAANVNPYSLGKYPYDPQIRGGSHISAFEHNLNISSFGLVYLPPIISSYVGPDITSGVLASRLQDRKGVTLFVDIGTNGEMVIGTDGKLSSASTAAGPAFEGMNITHGMRAAKGAIEIFDIEEDGGVVVKTIGEAKAIGICGSGLLDIIGELVANHVIGKNGKFVSPETADLKPELKQRLVKQDGKPVFEVADGVFLTQKDVRQVQLAKGAVRSGIEFLLKSNEVKAEQVDKVLIAGSFGYHLRAKSLINIGLLPSVFEGKIDFIGNTSKSGGRAFLLNVAYRKEMEELVGDIEVVELANRDDFDKVFVACLGF
ncbi:Na(+)-translocating NADH-quinone reductase subunit F [Sporomusa silvacetica DSM 10669]|uniref:Na(+)-translocating NADH-quinone reductase subunit F n=1 Tax=Sporomusa silvacetica DSM 10669 TaxID=1123289 RepID=A0ABZ3IEK8_9FIRM|nr:ASKHA domain-containing protein [Sporomusa silvacetica]OZC17940.1 Na(+)-translocating NADH-quinone reductase subunit F [Sporomusa silvacetica DSM 10669]